MCSKFGVTKSNNLRHRSPLRESIRVDNDIDVGAVASVCKTCAESVEFVHLE